MKIKITTILARVPSFGELAPAGERRQEKHSRGNARTLNSHLVGVAPALKIQNAKCYKRGHRGMCRSVE